MLSSHAPFGRATFVAAIASLAFALLGPGAHAAARVVGPTPPVIAGTPATTATEGVFYSFAPTASDADGDPLKFSIRGKPGWAVFDRRSGMLSGTAAAGTAGTYANVIISVTDGKNAVSLPAFSITVVLAAATAANTAPTISGTPATSAVASQLYSFQPTASDANGDLLTYNIQGKPAWASFSYASGALSGTPASTDVATYSNIVISVSDGKATASLPSFSITVTAPNSAPKISGTPATSVLAGQLYLFAPTASDADGDPLTFSIQGKPVWTTFDATMGTLYGTPTLANIGTTGNIVISVSDGKAASALAAFTIAVAPAPVSSVTVTWNKPIVYSDGTPLTDLAGYKVFYGSASRQYVYNISISGASMTSAVLEGLASGTTWYFSVKSVTSSGVESDFTPEVSKTLL